MEKNTFNLSLTALLILVLLIIAPNLEAKNSPSQCLLEKSSLISSNEDVILITKAELLEVGQVSFSPEDSEFSTAFRVISFTVSTKVGAYEESYEQTNGPRFTQKQISLIKKVKSKSKVYIENIKAVGPGGEIRNLGSIVFKIR